MWFKKILFLFFNPLVIELALLKTGASIAVAKPDRVIGNILYFDYFFLCQQLPSLSTQGIENWTDSGIVTSNSLASNAHWIHLEEEEVEEEELFGWKLQLSRDSNCAFQTFHLRQNFWDCRLTANAAIVYYQICQWTTERRRGKHTIHTVQGGNRASFPSFT